jgi:phosphatidylglycerophosphate synthase
MKEIIASLPREKRKIDSIWINIFLRPVSFPISWLLLRFHLSPSVVSYISAFICMAGGILFSLPGNYQLIGIGAILFNVFAVLDCVDGNMARVTGKAGPWGGWADAVTGYIAYTMVFFGTGMWIFWKTDYWPVLIIVGLTSSANLLTRVAFQMYKNIVGDSARKSVSLEKILANNTGITGFLMPIVLIFHYIDSLPCMWGVVWFNAAFYGLGCAASLFKLGIKAVKNS